MILFTLSLTLNIVLDGITIRHIFKKSAANKLSYKLMWAFIVLIGIGSIKLSFSNMSVYMDLNCVGLNINPFYSLQPFAIKEMAVLFPVGLIYYWIKYFIHRNRHQSSNKQQFGKPAIGFYMEEKLIAVTPPNHHKKSSQLCRSKHCMLGTFMRLDLQSA